MSAQYDLYETPDPANTGEQKPLHARIVPSGTYSKKEFLERVSRSSQTFNYNVIDAVVGVVIDDWLRLYQKDIPSNLANSGILASL